MLCKAWIKQSMWIRGRFKTIALFPFQDRKASTAMTRPSHKPQRVTLCSSLAPHHIETHSPPCLQRKNKTGWHCTIGNEPSSDSIVTTIANSNRCELEGAGNLFPAPSLKLGRIETLAQSGTAIVVTMKISEETGVSNSHLS